ncbi:MAG: 50S ribosomal protein L13 [Candidatus Buchananbacteria bacterium]|nr:50S ribosomal protein L13 [Candidatus Buchananbacteria bacterium]
METKKTTTTKKVTKKAVKPGVVRNIHEIDATDQILGRLATRIAVLLRGKNKATYLPHIDGGEFVVVTNASKIKTSGKKIQTKVYHRYSGYPGGIKTTKLSDLLANNASKMLRDTVYHMLPKNRTREKMIKRLKISN